ncbi:ABC transporter ATP-binding protein [Spiroplasma endosymbiont of Nebria brevicollis]|uniref:ABC transporter ATP-binding protein n=1 Tax=Spiroplasma endosymbiont of Nebria brevicollis TaxID=3066284 RepID=UPI00313B3F58
MDNNNIVINVQKYNIKFKNFNIIDINFKVYRGTIHALVGQSGSGKSVLLKSIIGAIPSSNYSGIITINNYKAGSAKSKSSLGFSLNLENFPQDLTAYIFLKKLGQATSIKYESLEHNIKKYLTMFNLWEHRNKKLNSFSSGMKNRIMIIQALIHNPDLIILDEPGANLDSESRKYFNDILETLKSEGKTILLTTHMINEIKDIVDSCTIMQLGKLLYDGSVTNFLIDKIWILVTSNVAMTIEILKKYNYKFKFDENNSELLVLLESEASINNLNFILFKNKIFIQTLYKKDFDLAHLKSFLT